MKRITALAFFAAALISIGGACAHAQTVEFKVPFDFAVGDRKLPLGTYRITSEGGGVLLIRSRDGASAAVTSTRPAYADLLESARGKLVFYRYGNQYFLHEVLCRAAGMNAEIPARKLEKQAQVQGARLRNNAKTVAVLQMPEQK